MTQPISPERSLQRCVAADPPSTLEALGDFRDSGFVDAWLKVAAAHRLTGAAVDAVLTAAAPSALEPTVRDRLTGIRDAGRRRRALFEMEIDRIDAALARAVDRPVWLKGAALARRVYAQPLNRDVHDLDVLVAPDQLDAAVAALAPLGYVCRMPPDGVAAYRKDHFHLQVERDNGIVVEVHWELTRPRDPWQLDAAAVRRAAVATNETVCRVPTLEDSILLAVLQSLQGGFSRLDRLVDIDRLLRAGADLKALSGVAADRRLAPAVDWAVELTVRLLGTPTPATDTLEALSPRRAALLERLDPEGLVLLRRGAGRPTLKALVAWLLSSTRAQRRALLAGMAAPDAVARWWNRYEGKPPPASGPLARAVAWGKFAAMRAALTFRQVR